nr:MAG TPA: vimentin [Caudoviricetes sp.]
MSMYFECELNKIDIDEVLSTVRYIEPEDLVVLYREKIRRLESMLKNSEDGAEKLMTENERLKEELKLVREDNCELREAVMTANMRNGVLTKRNRELKLLNANSDAYRKDVDQLTQENKKLIEERDALWDETQHLDKIYKQLLNEKKRLQENFEELKASSDLSMTAELAEIFSEFIDKDDKNRADLSAKIDEFKEKYQFE